MKLALGRDRMIEIFKALADEARLKILEALRRPGCCSCTAVPSHEPGMCVCDVVEAIGLSQPTVSHHLAILERAELIESKKIGRWMYYRRNEPFIEKLGKEFGEVL